MAQLKNELGYFETSRHIQKIDTPYFVSHKLKFNFCIKQLFIRR